MERPVFNFLKTAPSALKVAPTIEKVGLHKFRSCFSFCQGYHGSTPFYLFTLLPFYFSNKIGSRTQNGRGHALDATLYKTHNTHQNTNDYE